jgi:polyisoprenoid-binding protein YceI
MAIAAGTYSLGPDLATLTVKTRKTGAAAKAGHNLVIDVTAWKATLTVADDPAWSAIELTADSRSLRVREGSGGMTSLGDDEKASIQQSIDDEVLEGTAIEFRSTAVTPGADAGGLSVEGDLELHGQTHPIAFELSVGEDGTVSGSVTVKQSDWGMKPFSILFGTLKVVDEVEVEVSAALRRA